MSRRKDNMTKREMRAFIRSQLRPEGACRVWTGSHFMNGYGRVRWQGGHRTVHRLHWVLTHGEPPPDKPFVLHKCDNRACCRLAHLYTGTYKDNADDRERRHRGRQPRGEQNGKAKLTWPQVRAIRRAYATGRYSQHTLAQMFNIGRTQVHNIVTNKQWKEAA